MELQQSRFRALLLSLNNDFIAVCENAEIAYVEVGLQVGQLPFSARLFAVTALTGVLGLEVEAEQL